MIKRGKSMELVRDFVLYFIGLVSHRPLHGGKCIHLIQGVVYWVSLLIYIYPGWKLLILYIE